MEKPPIFWPTVLLSPRSSRTDAGTEEVLNTATTLSVRPPKPLPHKSFKINVLVKLSESVHVLSALIDPGAVGNFMDSEVAQKLQILIEECQQPLNIRVFDGAPIGEGFVTAHTQPFKLQISTLHCETMSFFLNKTQNQAIVLGFPWVQLHDRQISWQAREILQWPTSCRQR